MDNVIHSRASSLSKDFCTDIGGCVLFQAYEERIKAIVQVADELHRENFHDSDRIQQRFVKQIC